MTYFRKGTTIVDELGNPTDQTAALQTVNFNLDSIPQFQNQPVQPTPEQPILKTPQPTQTQPNDTQLQELANKNPEEADKQMDALGYTSTPLAPATSSYSGNSIRDYLGSIGQPSDFASRSVLAKSQGIQNYRGTADQNTQLLNTLRTKTPGTPNMSPVASAGAGLNTPPKPQAQTETGEMADTTPSTGNSTVDSLIKYFETKSPQSTFSEIYKQIYKDFGIDKVKENFETQTKELADLQEKKREEAENINANPWLSESLRQGQIKRLDEKYENKELIHQNRIKLYESQIDNARQDAQFIAGQTMTQLNRQADLNQDMILKAIDIAEKETEAQRKLPKEILEMEKLESDIETAKATRVNLYSQIAERDREGGVLVDQNGKVVVKQKDALKINKELTTTDAYRAIQKGRDSLQFLNEFEKKFKEVGLETFPGKSKGDLSTKYNTTILNLKEFFNLGVLNGPDEAILKSIIPDPTKSPKFLGFIPVSKKLSGVKSGVGAGIENMKKMIEASLDDKYASLSAQYGDYSRESIASLRDLDRIYIQQKSAVNPDIKKMVLENPSLSTEEIISIITE